MRSKIIIGIEGMHCVSCGRNIEKSLKKVPGIVEVNVNIMAKKGFINAEEKISEHVLKEAVARVGNYKVSRINYEQEAEEQESKDEMEHNGHAEAISHSNKKEGHQHGMGDEDEIKMWKNSMSWSWAFAIPIAIIMIADRILGFHPFSHYTMTLMLLILGAPVMFYFGFHVLHGGLKGFANLYFNMDTLISLGTIVAYATGALSFFMDIQDYSGVAAMIMAFFLTGKYIEAKARGKDEKEIKKLLELGAKK
ncbi:MAG: cation transporter, partial [Nanoarchaeota archaeon]